MFWQPFFYLLDLLKTSIEQNSSFEEGAQRAGDVVLLKF